MNRKKPNRESSLEINRDATIENHQSGSRRKLLRTLAAGGGAAVAFKSLPETWSQPVVHTVFLPAHAQTTGPALVGSGQGGSLITFQFSDPEDGFQSFAHADSMPSRESVLLDWIPFAHAQGGPPPGVPGPGGIISATFYARALRAGEGKFNVKVLLRVIFPEGEEDEEDVSTEGADDSLLNGLVGSAYAQNGPPQCVTDFTWDFDLEAISGADLDAPEGYRTNWSKRKMGKLACGNPRSLEEFEARFRMREIKSQTAAMQVNFGENQNLRFRLKDNGSIPSANCEGKPCSKKTSKKKVAMTSKATTKPTYVANAHGKLKAGRKSKTVNV